MGNRGTRWAGLLGMIPLCALAAPDKTAATEDEVIIIVTPEYRQVDAPMLLVPPRMSPTTIPVEENTGVLTDAYGESRPAPTGKRIPLRKSFTPELKDSVLEQ